MLSPVQTLPDQKYKTLSGEMIFPLFSVIVLEVCVHCFLPYISLIGFSTGIISAHCIYATNVGL